MKKLFLLLVLLLAAIPAFGQTAQLSPTIVAFGNTGIGTTSPAQTLTLTNSGGSNLILTSAPLLGGANASDFTISPSSTCTNGTSISPTFSCTVVMTFTPGAAGARAGTVSIFSNDPASPSVANLSGVGLSGGSNSITVNCPAASNCKVVGQITMTIGGGGSTTPPAIVTVSPSTGSVQINGTFPLVATVMNDPSNLGVTWSVSGANCSGSACGSISPASSLSGATVTYTAPPAAPVGAIFITATAVANNASFQSNVTVITPNPPPSGPAGVNVFTPSCAHASTTTTCAFTGYSGPTMIVNLTPVTSASTVTGVQGCISGSACQSLTLVGSVSGVYQFRGINSGAGFNQVVVSASDTNQVNVAISDTANVGAFDTFTTKTAGATTNPTGPSITTATANELVVCALDSSGTVTAAASPFVFNQVGNKDGYAATINPTASAISPSWTTTSGTYAALCGAYSVGTTPAAITVTNNPVSVNVQSSATQQFTAIVGNDPTNNGVNWACTPIGSCGTFSPTHTSSGQATTWTAPALVPPGAAVTLLQHVKLLDQTSPFTIPITSSSAGSTLCVFDVWDATGGTMSVTDSKGETWPAPVASRSRTSRGMSYACLPNNVGGVTSITVSVSGASPTSHEMYAREYSGMLSSSIVDQHAETGTSASPMDSGSMAATTNANDVLIGFGENGAASSFTAGNDGQGDTYVNLDQQTFLGSAVEDFFPTTATNTYKATMTPSAASGANMMVVALKASTGSGTGNANITVTSTSVADGTKLANSTVTLTAATPPISVVVNPTSGTLTAGSGTISITPTVTNDGSSAGVTWTLTGLGSISLNSSASGTPTVYTPPASVSTAQSVTITATSVTDTTKSASATILVNPTTGGGGGTGGLIACTDASCPAFQGALGNAQGGGAASLGGSGRNGTGPPQVFLITNLNDSGPGSLRNCLSAVGARFCIFRVPSGRLIQQSRMNITNPYVYVAGQTAAGGGIVEGGPGSQGQAFFISTHDVIIRYMTYDGAVNPDINVSCNPNIGSVGLEIASANNFNIIIDHNSHRWWGNKDFEVISNGPNQNVHDYSMQNNLGYEPCLGHHVITEPDVNQGGSQFASQNQDWHHNLFMNYDHRCPLLAIRSIRWVNNVCYNGLTDSQTFNWSSWGAVQGDIIGSKYLDGPQSVVNVINIVDQADPTSSLDKADCNPSCDNGPAQGRYPGYYLQNNLGHTGSVTTTNGGTLIPITNAVNDAGELSMTAQVTKAEGAANPTAMPNSCTGSNPATVNCWFRSTPLPAETFPITVDPVTNLDAVMTPTVGNSTHLDCQGNAVSNRDSQDSRVIAQYLARGPGGAWNPTGSSPYRGPAYGAAPAIPAGTLCPMSLNDGIYDGWKQKYGLSTTDPNLWKQKGKSGYLRIEEFLNGIIPQ